MRFLPPFFHLSLILSVGISNPIQSKHTPQPSRAGVMILLRQKDEQEERRVLKPHENDVFFSSSPLSDDETGGGVFPLRLNKRTGDCFPPQKHEKGRGGLSQATA